MKFKTLINKKMNEMIHRSNERKHAKKIATSQESSSEDCKISHFTSFLL